MAFNAGAIVATAKVDDSKWTKGLKAMTSPVGLLVAAVGFAAKKMADATKAANEWQKELNNVNTLLDTTIVNSQEMALSLINLDSNLGQTTELTTAMYQAFSSGAEDMDEALQITTDAAKFAKAAVTDTATSVDVLTTAQNAYGSEVVTTTQASDIFFTTIKQGKLTGEQLASTIGKSIPLFASLNIPLEELGSGMAAMTKQGVNAAESTTQLNGIVNSFLKPSADMTAALKAQGIESGSALLESEGLSGALEFLEKASGGSKDELSKLLPSVEAVRGVLALTGKGGEEFNAVLREMERAAGATDIAFQKQNNVLENMQVSGDKVELIFGNIGKLFQDKIAVGITDANEGMLDWLQSAGGMELVGGLVDFVAGTFDVLGAVLNPLFDSIIPGLSDVIGTLFTEINDIMGSTAGATGAFDVLGMVVSTLSVGFKQLVSVAGGVVTTVGNLVEAIVLSGNAIGSFFEFLAGKKTWEEVKGSVGEAGVAFKDFGLGVVETFFDVSAELKAASAEWLDGAIDTSKNIESAITNNFKKTEAETISSYLAMITGQKNMTDEVIDSNDNMTDTVDDQNKDLAENTEMTMASVGQSVLNFIDGISKKWGDAYDAIVSVIDTGMGAIESITSLSFGNQLDELELMTRDSLDAIDLFYDNRIELLREVTEAEKDLSADHRQIELEELTAFANEKLEIDNEFRQAEIDALTELSEEELALEAFKRAEKIAMLEASTNEEDQLELAAMLAKEAREAQLLLTQTSVEAERKALKDAALAEEERRQEELLATEKEIQLERELMSEAAQTAEETRLTSLAQAEQDKADAIADTEAAALVESNSIAKSQFETQQSLQIASVWMDTASAIAGFWSVAPMLGPIAGPIFGGVMTAAMLGVGGVQSALINEQQFIPARETGGMASGLTRINEAGGEIVTLPDGSQVIPNDVSQQIANNSGRSSRDIIIDIHDNIVNSDSDIEELAREISQILGEELMTA